MAAKRRPLAIAAARTVAPFVVVAEEHSAELDRAAVTATGIAEVVAEDVHSTARSMRAVACSGAWATAARGGIDEDGTRDVGREDPDDIQALLAARRSSLWKIRLLHLLCPLTYSEDGMAGSGESVRAVFGCIEGRMLSSRVLFGRCAWMRECAGWMCWSGVGVECWKVARLCFDRFSARSTNAEDH